jgi:hypothetical protein
MKSIKLLWLAIIPLTAFWLFSLDIYGLHANQGLSLAWLTIGVVITAIGYPKKEIDIDKRYAIIAIPLAVSSIAIPYPYNVGIALVAIGSIGFATTFLRPIFFGAGSSGLILITQSLILIPYFVLIPSFYNADILSHFIYGFMKVTGLNPSIAHNHIFINLYYTTFSIPTTWNKLGLYPFLLILSPLLSSVFVFSQNLRAMIKGFLVIILISLVYIIIRYLSIIHFFFISRSVNTSEVNGMLTTPLWLLVSFVPFVLLIIALSPLEIKDSYKSISLNNVKREHWIAGMAIFISIFLITAAAVFQDPGVLKEGRILVDERNNPWETSTLKMDKEWYGIGSTYNAYNVIEWLKNSYRVDRIMDLDYERLNISNVSKVKSDIDSDLITSKILDDYDILIIKTPKPYHKEEIKAIENFVKNGGGLLLIGDHSDFSGTSTSLNEIAKNFGIKFEFDTVNGASNEFYTYAREGKLPFINRGLSHPCLKYMPYFEFMTSCSIVSLPFNEQVMRGGALVTEPGEYVTSNFFKISRNKDVSHEWDRDYGIFNQAIAVKYGKGRIVAFTDSTTISNFRCFFGGTPNLIVGIIEYLNKKNQYQYLAELFLVLGLIFAALVFYFLRNECRITAILLILVIGSIAVSAAIITFAETVEDSVPVRYYDKDYTICFDSEHSANILDTPNLFDHQSYRDVYNVFFIWTQRGNITPFIGNLEDCLERGNVVAIIDPVKRLAPPERDSIKRFIESGGKLLVMLNNTEDPSKNLIKEFKLDLENIDAIHQLDHNSFNKTLPIEPWGLSIIGGKSLKKVGNRTILAQSHLGKGMILVFAPSYVFRDGINGNPGYMGSIATIPDKSNLPYDLRALYNLEYYIIELCFSNNSCSRSPSLFAS